jgi:hypothetical protein
MRNGNTETFPSVNLPDILQAIETFQKGFPGSEITVKRDISELIPAPKPTY